MNAAKPGESAATQNVRQDRFGLIVGGMRDSDLVQMMFAGALREKSVAETPRGSLQIGFVIFGDGLYGAACRVKRQFIFVRQSADNSFIRVGRRATKFMIEM